MKVVINMSYYYEHLIKIDSFKGFVLSDLGNLYCEKTGIMMTPLFLKDVKIFKNKYDKYLMITQSNGEWFYTTTTEKKMSRPQKLTLDLNKFYEASVIIDGVKHIKYVPGNKAGIVEAEKWAEKLELLCN